MICAKGLFCPFDFAIVKKYLMAYIFVLSVVYNVVM